MKNTLTNPTISLEESRAALKKENIKTTNLLIKGHSTIDQRSPVNFRILYVYEMIMERSPGATYGDGATVKYNGFNGRIGLRKCLSTVL